MTSNFFIYLITFTIISSASVKTNNISKDISIKTSKTYTNIKKGDLDWFKEVQYLFPRNSNAVIIDIDTKKTFKVKRTFGTNHADVEPLTIEDTNIIKEIWGGNWSWEKRAVIVKTEDGHLIAGSMSAFPHAGLNNKPTLSYVKNRSGGFGSGQNLNYIKNNGIDGHMDIHFLNSKTHNSNKINKEHQLMVKKASVYIKNNY